MNQTTPGDTGKRAIVVSSACAEGTLANQLGREAYSYRFVYQIFAPLLRRWGQVVEVTRPESRLDYTIHQLRRQGLEPIHLSFLPLHMTYLTQLAPNVAVPAWEFPDIPNVNLLNNPRNNWVRIADQLDVIVTHCHVGRKAFEKAGVRKRVHVVPVPIPAEYFDVPDWNAGHQGVIESPCYVLAQAAAPAAAGPNPWQPPQIQGLSLKERARQIYKNHVKPRLPANLDRYLTMAARAVGAARRESELKVRVSHPETPQLELSGVVYTTIFNSYDPRKNWTDMLSAFLLALGDCEDATLVMKLVVPPELAAVALNGILDHYRRIGITHRCKLVFVTGYLTDAQMMELARCTTCYLNASRAEGSCLPLQNFLAAGRPGVAPVHTGMSDYFEENVGFVVESHAEPASWPHDIEQRFTTRWHRLVWQSLHDQFRHSYEVARRDPQRFQELATRGRQRAREYASAESVWPLLLEALDEAARKGGVQPLRRSVAARARRSRP